MQREWVDLSAPREVPGHTGLRTTTQHASVLLRCRPQTRTDSFRGHRDQAVCRWHHRDAVRV